ncbi:MAG: RsmD family RNA methyltransferase [Clostridia bacterium]|nr:RsmD family RNA methyltransferase [Clostridia bacterium]
MKFEINQNSSFKKKLDDAKGEERLGIHSFHRYYGKLIPAIPAVAIEEFTVPGEIVFDPFSGSGTTAVEAITRGRKFVGFEINPLAQKIASTKTKKLNPLLLNRFNEEILRLLKSKNYIITEADYPYVLNREHWFKDFVQLDLIRIKKAVEDFFDNRSPADEIVAEDYKNFYFMTISAILRNVSNADTMHVFPGISKRMRALEAEGKIHIDVIASFERAIKKRVSYYEEANISEDAEIILADSTQYDVTDLENTVSLIVTNPPYISSVRYIETLKLEMYWMEYIKSSTEYSALAHQMLGNDMLRKAEYASYELTGYDEIDAQIASIAALDRKSAKIISEFFIQMEKVLSKMSLVLKTGGKAVVKISDSKIKKTKIETGRFMSIIAKKYGLILHDVFLDEINNNSRSLTTARNTYSDIITHDYIIIWEKQ